MWVELNAAPKRLISMVAPAKEKGVKCVIDPMHRTERLQDLCSVDATKVG
jgi:hypothetical protein